MMTAYKSEGLLKMVNAVELNYLCAYDFQLSLSFLGPLRAL